MRLRTEDRAASASLAPMSLSSSDFADLRAKPGVFLDQGSFLESLGDEGASSAGWKGFVTKSYAPLAHGRDGVLDGGVRGDEDHLRGGRARLGGRSTSAGPSAWKDREARRETLGALGNRLGRHRTPAAANTSYPSRLNRTSSIWRRAGSSSTTRTPTSIGTGEAFRATSSPPFAGSKRGFQARSAGPRRPPRAGEGLSGHAS